MGDLPARPPLEPTAWYDSISVYRRLYDPALREMLRHNAEAPVGHVLRRLSVLLQQALRDEGQLPERIEPLLARIGGGAAALGQEGSHFRVCYERRHGTQACLSVDPLGPSPAYVEATVAQQLSEQGLRRLTKAPTVAGVKITPLAADIDGTAPDFPAPPLPQGVQ